LSNSFKLPILPKSISSKLLSRAHVPRSESPALVDALAIVFKYGKHPFAIRTDDYLHHWLGNFD